MMEGILDVERRVRFEIYIYFFLVRFYSPLHRASSNGVHLMRTIKNVQSSREQGPDPIPAHLAYSLSSIRP